MPAGRGHERGGGGGGGAKRRRTAANGFDSEGGSEGTAGEATYSHLEPLTDEEAGTPRSPSGAL